MDEIARVAAEKTRLWQTDWGLDYLHIAAFTKTAPLHGSGPDLKSNCPPVQHRFLLNPKKSLLILGND